MPDSKITGLTADPTPTSDDLVATVDDPLGTPTNRKVTLAQLALGLGGAWQAWTPTWANFTLGNGTNDAKYMQIGKTVFFRVVTTLGSTSSMSTNPNFSLPITSTATPAADLPIAQGQANSGSGARALFVKWLTTTTARLMTWDINVDEGAVTSTTPFTWGNGHKILVEGFYEIA